VSPLLLGHRGDPANHVENSVVGFAAALRCGADGVELDVHLSADAEPVVIHDPTLERTTAGAGRVDAHSAAELGALGVPHLGTVLPMLRDHVAAVELKPSFDDAPSLARTVLDLAAPEQRVLVFAFDPRHLGAALGRRPSACTVLLTKQRPAQPRDVLRTCGATMLACEWHAIDAALCAEVPVIAWTVDAAGDARHLLDMGVHALISNDPCALRDVVPRA
jgi:glycerophosphoryl diester phosphodiesterase